MTAMTFESFTPIDVGNGQMRLACYVKDSPWKYNTGFDMLINELTGEAKPRTTWPAKPSNTTIGEINAEVYMHATDARGRESGIGLEGDVGKIVYVDGVAKRLRGDGSEWRLKQAHLRREEQARRVKGWNPIALDARPADYMTAADQAAFKEQAKSIMAQLCNLSRYLPHTEACAVKHPTRMLEAVEREMWSIEGANRETTRQIAGEYRALGGGVPEITNTKIERLERRRQGLSFQYAHYQMLFAAWRESYDEIMTEHGGLATSLLGAEFDGHTWNYVKLRDRVERRKKLAKETDKAWETQKAMLLKLPMQDYHRWLHGRTAYEPRHGQPQHEATPETAQPMTGWEIDSDPNDRE